MKVWVILVLLSIVNSTPVSMASANTLPIEIVLPTIEIKSTRFKEVKEKVNSVKKEKKERVKRSFFELPSLNFYKSVNKEFSTNLKQALESYAGPKFTISSGVRHGDRKSNHYSGNAIDIHYDGNAEAFIEWTESSEGKDWLESNNIAFYIEDYKSSSKNDLPTGFDKYFRRISWASGLHIHLEVK